MARAFGENGWLIKRGNRGKVESNRVRGRSQRRWEDEVKELLIGRGLSESEGMALAGMRSQER